MKFSKKTMNSIGKTVQESLRKEKGVPSKVTVKDMDSKKRELSRKQFAGLFEARNVFIRKHGRVPNYVTLNSTANNPLVIDYQDNKYNCCPTSLSMAIQFLYGNVSESKCAKVLQTNKNGTDPFNLVAHAPELGYKVNRISRSYAGVKKALKIDLPVIAHIQTKPATCLGYTGDYGHYILIYGVTKDGYYLIADPTKGLKKCSPKILDKATNGRDIGYYMVKPK